MRDNSRLNNNKLPKKAKLFSVKSNRHRNNLFNAKYTFEVIEVDDCEYLIGSQGYGGYFTHKGNCKYCEERRNNS